MVIATCLVSTDNIPALLEYHFMSANEEFKTKIYDHCKINLINLLIVPSLMKFYWDKWKQNK